jgi:uncharacterized lipoprotein YddW (UPF0748 family)
MKTCFIAFFLLLIFNYLSFPQITHPKYEFRGAWVATVANIDWPSNRNSTSGEQIAELVSIMDKLKDAGINAVFFQVRTECDALYNSSIEPWSYWLTGIQGKSPEPYFDPLEFAINEAHKRGMELHAWFNPYRSVKESEEYQLSEKHVSVQHPEWILSFGKYKMLDPGLPQVQNYILSVMTDVLLRYDIDGIHFDDYFYPYSPKVSYQDSLTYERYKGSYTNLDDWRRNNINELMRQIHKVIQAVKPFVKFGISPFGVVENHYASTNAFESYKILYCDPLTWINEKIVDYVNPQLYWEIDHDKAAYRKLLPWWASVTKDIHLYIGHWSGKFSGLRYTGSRTEMGDQLRMNRITENVQGSVFFSGKSIFEKVGGFADSLKQDFYKYPALPNLMPWKDKTPPLPPKNVSAKIEQQTVTLTWDNPGKAEDGDEPNYYIIYRFTNNEEINLNDPKFIAGFSYQGRTRFKDNIELSEDKKYTYLVTSVDRLHNESIPGEMVYVSAP